MSIESLPRPGLVPALVLTFAIALGGEALAAAPIPQGTVPDLLQNGNTVGAAQTAAQTAWPTGGTNVTVDVDDGGHEGDLVKAQHPPAGSTMTQGQAIHLVLKPSSDDGPEPLFPLLCIIIAVVVGVVAFFVGRMTARPRR